MLQGDVGVTDPSEKLLSANETNWSDNTYANGSHNGQQGTSAAKVDAVAVPPATNAPNPPQVVSNTSYVPPVNQTLLASVGTADASTKILSANETNWQKDTYTNGAHNGRQKTAAVSDAVGETQTPATTPPMPNTIAIGKTGRVGDTTGQASDGKKHWFGKHIGKILHMIFGFNPMIL